MLRDPVDLMFSNKCQNTMHPKRPFTLSEPTNVTLTQISIVEPLNVWLEVFPQKRNWLFLKSEDFFADQQRETDKVFKFLGLKSVDVAKLAENEQDSDGQSLANGGRRRCQMKAMKNERKAYFSVQD